MTNAERLQLILDKATSAKMCVDEDRKVELDDFLWDIEALIDACGCVPLRPILDRCKEQTQLCTKEDLKKSLDLLRGRTARIATWWD